ncbi:hypothetical protein E6O75_ATG06314 [Venturia nashicola]|uniref:Uncharacterized protein n=1 Tax=Venturia nashicola TaxID=86259 RepID=A0A4Z1PB84_9PEZI|nr:hypothetical protein E6O75_ATG06314 [Venturia nashicola]
MVVGDLAKTATGTVGGVAPGVVPDAGSAVPGGVPAVPGAPDVPGAQGAAAPTNGEEPQRDALLGNLADVDTAKDKDLLNVGGEQGKGNINLLTKDKEKKPAPANNTNASNNTGKTNNTNASNGDGGGNSSGEQDESKSHSKTCPPSNGIFYAYAAQVGTGKKYLLTFPNAKVANEYFDKVAEVHKGDAYRESDQFLTLGPNISIESATKGVAFNQFQGRMFVQEVDGSQPIIPPQNKKGYIMGYEF